MELFLIVLLLGILVLLAVLFTKSVDFQQIVLGATIFIKKQNAPRIDPNFRLSDYNDL
jgi:hypothetical protein